MVFLLISNIGHYKNFPNNHHKFRKRKLNSTILYECQTKTKLNQVLRLFKNENQLLLIIVKNKNTIIMFSKFKKNDY